MALPIAIGCQGRRQVLPGNQYDKHILDILIDSVRQRTG